MKNIENRNELILAGLYLSKFDKEGLNKLGFSSFTEAFNVIGYALSGNPASIKNYRDEFDPYFDNNRQGWHKRELRDYCKKVMESAKNFSIDEFSKIIKNFIVKDFGLKYEINKLIEKNDENTFLSRTSTGLAAENYFIENYKKHFNNYTITDTRTLGCGFDFKLDLDEKRFFIEVKGLKEKKGNFLMTEKEYNVASSQKDKYCLYVVRNFKEKPFEELFFNPLEKFELKKYEQKIVITNYQGKI